MERRRFLKFCATGVSSSGVPCFSYSALGQSANVVDEMLSKRPWLDRVEFERLRRFASLTASLRIAYNGPNGYEADSEFREGLFNAWSTVLGKDVNQGYTIATSQVAPALSAIEVNKLREPMFKLLTANQDNFVAWLDSIGVEPNGQLQKSILRGQTYFAVAASLLMADADLTFFSKFTWIYPFC